MKSSTLFLTSFGSPAGLTAVRLGIASLRRFGGELAGTPVWIFAPDPQTGRRFEEVNSRLLPLDIPEAISAYPFSRKVAACARAEQLAPPGTGSLVWIDPAVLVVQPPALFELGLDCDAAFRPVHIRNVGLPPSEPLDAFWRGIYAAAGVDDIPTTVTSFVDGQLLRAYYNSHAFAINPALGLMQRWYNLFRQLVGDGHFQSEACPDEPHQVFLFQALLSTLVATSVDPARVRPLPPTYNYPLHLQDRVPEGQRLAVLDEAVCFTYEELSLRPDRLTGIQVREPLRSWLEARAGNS